MRIFARIFGVPTNFTLTCKVSEDSRATFGLTVYDGGWVAESWLGVERGTCEAKALKKQNIINRFINF